MKKYLVVGMFLILSACGTYINPDSSVTITKISKWSTNYCKYETYGNKTNNYLLYVSGEVHIRSFVVDNCGKFNIGDTVQLRFVKVGEN